MSTTGFEHQALALCALLGVDGGKIEDSGLPTNGQTRVEVIAEWLKNYQPSFCWATDRHLLVCAVNDSHLLEVLAKMEDLEENGWVPVGSPRAGMVLYQRASLLRRIGRALRLWAVGR